ncbi:LPS biosynthesis sugar transferase [Nonlabens dokdonensis]|mgnify:CR=1 FL=1|uniref:LPS biosynthesis sugar transferase n=1 Tax=Nonlabens dokdonensis TaxID=328515 RepID=A0A1Z8APC8_9FLAO|nr:sugar transferase [Nonlabens dokdonensis]OUS12190.1 LPS biosynthesis sugar transferase [Nonlabens dokdonensis]
MNRLSEVLISFISILLISIPLLFLTIYISLLYEPLRLFTQMRIGQYGKPFAIYKLQTMKNGKVTKTGKILRRTKIDELPQLINILKGDMSFVGPRPDLPGYYDILTGDNRKVLQLKPGLTSLAAIKYRNEEKLLLRQLDPLRYNDEVIFPDKVKMNLEYVEKRGFIYDIKIILLTFKSLFK